MSDTDEHEFYIEGATLQNEDGAGNLQPSPDPESGETQLNVEQQKFDNKLLTEAGFAVEEMDEAERQNILWALKDSIHATEPANPTTSGASHSKELRREENKEIQEEEYLPEDPLQAVSMTVTDDAEQVCDSTTSTAPSRTKKARGSRRKQQSDASSSSETETLNVSRTRRSRHKQKKATEESDTSGKSEDGESMGDDLMTRSMKKLTAKQREMMKLSPKRKEQCQTRFKDLLNKTTLSLSQQSKSSQGSYLSPVKEGAHESDDVPQSSQDLFPDQRSEEEKHLEIQSTPLMEPLQPEQSACSPSRVRHRSASRDGEPVKRIQERQRKTRTPSPVQILSEDSSSVSEVMGGTQEFSVDGQHLQPEELETQPPQDFLGVRVEERDEEEEDSIEIVVTDEDQAKQELDERSSSPVYPAHVTQPSCSSPQPSRKDKRIQGISPSKLPITDEKDKRPLLHDNWFSWPHVPPVCHLQRNYRNSSRKRKELPTDFVPYLRPKSVSPEQHSKAILQMLDTYLLRFTRMQCCFQKLPWGKPVHTGLHLPGTLDIRKRGAPAFCFNLEEEEEEEEFENEQPPTKNKRLVTGNNAQQKKRLGLLRNTQGSARKMIVDREGKVRVEPGDSGGVRAETQAAYDAETQPMESDELPDIQLSTDTKEKGRSMSRNSEDKRIITPSPVLGSQGSQSSNSLLDERGELYSTQLPHRKRRVEAGNPGLNLREERPKRVCTNLQQSQLSAQVEDEDSNSEVPPLARKRKQISPSEEENQFEILNDDDDDDEVSFPHKKKMHMNKSFVHISSSQSIHLTTQQTVVRPRPRRGNGAGNTSGLHLRKLYDSGDSLFQPIRQNTSTKGDGKPSKMNADFEESDDSVQFVDPSSLKQTEERRIHVQPQQVQVGEAKKIAADIIGVASSSHSQPAEPMVQEEDGVEEEQVECPLCGRQFPISIIQGHASDCTGEELQVQQELPDLERRTAYSTQQLKRRPLRGGVNREDFSCGLCGMNMGGSSALLRHFEKCRQQYEREEACNSAGGVSAMPAWLNRYKIPSMEKDGAKGYLEIQPEHEEEKEERIEEYSDDSCKDPDFTLTKDDKRQEKEDNKEDDMVDDEDDNASVSRLTSTSNRKSDQPDFPNQSSKKPPRRRTKAKDK